MANDSKTTSLNRYHCVDEGRELQLLLEHNLDLLPGDQIDPENRRRWLLVKREMPVVSPALGAERWSLDFLLVDQDGIPALVECKRRNDARNLRETVGQMLEYAANGHHYWEGARLQEYASKTAGDDSKLNEQIRILTGSDVDAGDFFAGVHENLRNARMRLIFFLDDSPNELRSMVEFLNGQMKDTEVLIVEARQYRYEGATIVVPWVFGFTEEARVAKKESRTEIGSARRRKAAITKEEYLQLLGDNFPEVKVQLNEFIGKLERCEVKPDFKTSSMILRWKDWSLGLIKTGGKVETDNLSHQARRLNLLPETKQYLGSLASLVPGAEVKESEPENGNWGVFLGKNGITVDALLADDAGEGWLRAIKEFQAEVKKSPQGELPNATTEDSPV
jgi:hypothetical protein